MSEKINVNQIPIPAKDPDRWLIELDAAAKRAVQRSTVRGHELVDKASPAGDTTVTLCARCSTRIEARGGDAEYAAALVDHHANCYVAGDHARWYPHGTNKTWTDVTVLGANFGRPTTVRVECTHGWTSPPENGSWIGGGALASGRLTKIHRDAESANAERKCPECAWPLDLPGLTPGQAALVHAQHSRTCNAARGADFKPGDYVRWENHNVSPVSWLEGELLEYGGGVASIKFDRSENITNRLSPVLGVGMGGDVRMCLVARPPVPAELPLPTLPKVGDYVRWENNGIEDRKPWVEGELTELGEENGWTYVRVKILKSWSTDYHWRLDQVKTLGFGPAVTLVAVPRPRYVKIDSNHPPAGVSIGGRVVGTVPDFKITGHRPMVGEPCASCGGRNGILVAGLCVVCRDRANGHPVDRETTEIPMGNVSRRLEKAPELYDGLTADECFDRWWHNYKVLEQPGPKALHNLTPPQITAGKERYRLTYGMLRSVELQRKVDAARERDRRQVVVDQEDD